jgi:CDP-glycerol glycerophosphotransferase (TagB/SpsB family)
MSKYVSTGAQRNDFLFSSNGKKNLAYLLDDKLLMNNKKIIFYMPTYRYTPRGNRTEGNRNWMNIFGFSSFDMRNFIVFLEENDYYFIIKLHPAEEKKFIDKIPPNKNIIIITNEILGKKGLDLYEILNAANIIITDYSSVCFDTLLLDIPVVFTPIDIEEYQRDRGFLLEPYEKWTPGPKCLTQETLQEEIFKSLSDHSYFNKERKDLLKKIHKYVDGNSCKRTWKFIEQLSENI